MVDWNDHALQAKLSVASTQLVYAILGLYGWEYVRSSHIETTLLRRQLSFRWPLIPYITGRFSFLLAVILLAMQFSPFKTSVDCQCMTLFIMFSTNVAIACSTINLSIRTWIIWNTSYEMRILLVLLTLGQWTILSLFVASARASTTRGICMIDYVSPAYATAAVMYNMVYDSLLFIFTFFGLWRMPSSSTLWKTLVKQGVVYLAINLIVNIIILVLNRLNFNPIMNSIFGFPGACICTITSSQAVYSLLHPAPDDASTGPSLVKDSVLTDQFPLPVFTSNSGAYSNTTSR